MNVKKCVRALLCLYLTLIITMDAVKAQALKVGDTLPPELWSMPLQVINHPAGKETLTLSEYKDKLIILDFWATWCSPCIAMLPKQDSLQRQFKDQIQILPVTYQTGEEVSIFMERYEKRKGVKNSLPKVVDSKALHSAFPHTVIPHYVWIDADGIVKAITGHEEVKAEKIEAFVSGKPQSLEIKQDIKKVQYDNSRPLFIDGNGGEVNDLRYHSLLSGYTEGLNAGYSIDRRNGIKITATNMSIVKLFRLAYGEGNKYLGINRTLVADEVRDELASPSTSEAYGTWKREGNVYCFELIVPPMLSDSAFKIMQRILRENFPRYDAKLEKLTRRCLLLKRTSTDDKIGSKGETQNVEIDRFSCRIINAPMSNLTYRMALMYMPYSPFPILDDTGYTDNVDLILNADLTDLESVNKELKQYDLRFVEDDYDLEMLVIAKSDKL